MLVRCILYNYIHIYLDYIIIIIIGGRSLCSVYRDVSLLWDVRAPVHNIAMLTGGEIITANGADGLQVYDKKTGQKIKHPILDLCTESIWDVSVDDGGATVAAVGWGSSGPGRLHICMSVNDRWKHQKHNICLWPRSVACTSDRHFIVGSNNNSMYKYNVHGHQIWKKNLSFQPLYISIDHKNRILVSNNDGGCVTIYNEDGVEMFSFPAATDQRNLKPRGLCVDDEDNILVVEEDSKSVLLFDSRRQFIKKLVDID